MRLTFWRVVGLSTLWVFACLSVGAALAFRRAEAMARTTGGDAYFIAAMPGWLVATIWVPPLLLLVLWLWQRARGRGGR